MLPCIAKSVALAGLLSAALFSQHAAAQGLFWGNSYEARQPQYAAYGGQAGYGAYAAPQYGAYGAQAHYGSPNQVYDEEYRPQASPIPRQLVSFDTRYAPGTIVISTEERRLYYVTSRGEAIQYARRRRPSGLRVVRHQDGQPPSASGRTGARRPR